MFLSFILPCYNELENIPRIRDEFCPVVQQLAESQQVEIVFIDDGSQDGTWEALRETFQGNNDLGIDIRIERHQQNRGLGAALRTGFAAARGEVIVTTDSDGTYEFDSLPDLLSLLAPDVDIVTGSPYHPQGGVDGVPAFRLVLSKGSSLIYRLLVDWKIHTYTSLYRVYRRRVIENITSSENGYMAGTEILVRGMLEGYRVVEYPTVLRVRQYGASKARILRTILAHLKFQGWILLRSFRSKSNIGGKNV